jgi:hypothetical protein
MTLVRTGVTGERESEDQRNRRLAYQRKRSASNRSSENEEQRNARLTAQRKRLASDRSSENEEQRNARLIDQRKRSASNRSSENEEQRNARLTAQRKRSSASRLSKSEERRMPRRVSRQQCSKATQSISEKRQIIEKNQVMNIRRQQQVLAENRQTLFDQYTWPAAIPTLLKEYCLQDFCNQTSMQFLRQSVCLVCNIRSSASAMKEYNLENISNLEKLSCHTDLIDIIGKITSQTAESGRLIYEIVIMNMQWVFFYR